MNIQNMHVYDILKMLAPTVQSYLGIGVQEGECVRGLVSINPSVDLILCDTWGPHHGGTNRGSEKHIEEMLNNHLHTGTRAYLNGSSQKLIPHLTTFVDMAFVDGDHQEQPAYEDLINTWPLVEHWMVVHDTQMPSVLRALHRFIEYNHLSMSQMSISTNGSGTWVIQR